MVVSGTSGHAYSLLIGDGGVGDEKMTDGVKWEREAVDFYGRHRTTKFLWHSSLRVQTVGRKCLGLSFTPWILLGTAERHLIVHSPHKPKMTSNSELEGVGVILSCVNKVFV
jgi:hypothetical protein